MAVRTFYFPWSPQHVRLFLLMLMLIASGSILFPKSPAQIQSRTNFLESGALAGDTQAATPHNNKEKTSISSVYRCPAIDLPEEEGLKARGGVLVRNATTSRAAAAMTLASRTRTTYSSNNPRPRRSSYKRTQTRKTAFLSQDGEDIHLLMHWFNGLCGGRYLEMGGLDGRRFSNTFAFQKLLNWSGVLVEINPDSFAKMTRNRPNDICVNAAVCAEARKVHWVVAEKAALVGIWEFAPPTFRERWWKNIMFNDTRVVECSPLQKLLDDNAPQYGYYDFYSLDVEGAELEALKSIDFSRTAFGVVLVEADRHNPDKNEAVRHILESNGYVYKYHLLRSSWFVNKDFDKIYASVL